METKEKPESVVAENTDARWKQQAIRAVTLDALKFRNLQRQADCIYAIVDDPRPDPRYVDGHLAKLNLFSIRVSDDNHLGVDTCWLAQMIHILLNEKFGEEKSA